MGGRRRAIDLGGKVAVVTGASAGLGRRLALDLARAGAVVVGLARRADRLAILAEELQRISPTSTTEVCDLADLEAFVDLLERAEAAHGQVDLLCNIAGMGGVLRSEPVTTESIREVMEVNFVAPYIGMLTVLPGMRQRGFGVIVNMSSDDARAPGSGAGDYSASKAALAAATESLAYDVRPDGVICHVAYPGWMPTEMGLTAVREGGLRMPPRAVRRSEAQVSARILRRLGDPRLEINAAALPLVAPVLRTLAPALYQRLRARR